MADATLSPIKENIRKIDELEKKQKDLIEKTTDVSDVKKRIEELEQAMKKIDELSQKQSELMKNPAREGQDSDSQVGAGDVVGPDSPDIRWGSFRLARQRGQASVSVKFFVVGSEGLQWPGFAES